jgi:hypothetical protein
MQLNLETPVNGLLLTRDNMRVGILISCANSEAQKLIDMIEGICIQHDAKMVFHMKTLNEIRLVEKKSEEI